MTILKAPDLLNITYRDQAKFASRFILFKCFNFSFILKVPVIDVLKMKGK